MKADDDKIHAISIDPDLEKRLADSIKQVGEEREIVLNAEFSKDLMESISKELENLMKKGFSPVVVCSSGIRPYLSRFIARFLPNVQIVSYDEIPEDVILQIEGVVRL